MGLDMLYWNLAPTPGFVNELSAPRLGANPKFKPMAMSPFFCADAQRPARASANRINSFFILIWFGLCACGTGARLLVWCFVDMIQKSEPLASSAATFTALPNGAEDAIATHGKPCRHRPWRCAWSYEKHSRSLCAIGWTRW